jgi:hypothetical protein
LINLFGATGFVCYRHGCVTPLESNLVVAAKFSFCGPNLAAAKVDYWYYNETLINVGPFLFEICLSPIKFIRKKVLPVRFSKLDGVGVILSLAYSIFLYYILPFVFVFVLCEQ